MNNTQICWYLQTAPFNLSTINNFFKHKLQLCGECPDLAGSPPLNHYMQRNAKQKNEQFYNVTDFTRKITALCDLLACRFEVNYSPLQL